MMYVGEFRKVLPGAGMALMVEQYRAVTGEEVPAGWRCTSLSLSERAHPPGVNIEAKLEAFDLDTGREQRSVLRFFRAEPGEEAG